MDKNRKTFNPAMRAASILFCLTMFSFWALSGTYAKYMTKTSGGDGARVAVFDISDTNSLQQTFAVSLNPKKTEKIDIEITNRSEVAVRYIFTYETEGNIPLTINMKAENDLTAPVRSGNENIFTTEREPAGQGSTDSYTAELSMSDSGYQYSGGVQWITLTLKAEQID